MPHPTKISLALLLCISTLFTACRKEKYTYAGKIEGTYNWHHTSTSHLPFGPSGGTYTIHPDETFDIQSKNKKQITLKGETLDLSAMDDYTVTYSTGKPEGTYRSLVYNKTTHTLVYSIGTHVSAAGNFSNTYTSY